MAQQFVEGGDEGAELGVADLAAANLHADHRHRADGIADVEVEVEQREALILHPPLQPGEGEGVERRPHETRRQPLDEGGPGHVPGAQRRRPVPHLPGRPGDADDPQDQQRARVRLLAQLAHDDQADDRADAARQHQIAGLQRRIAAHLLQLQRQQDQRQEHHRPDQEDEALAQSEIAVEEQATFDEGVAAGDRVDDEDIERHGGDDGLDHDLARREPVQPLAPRQHQLQDADADHQAGEAQPVQRRFLRFGPGHQEPGHREAYDAGGDGEVEDPWPAPVLDQDAAYHRRHDIGGHEP